jgi:hypothetical protein
MQLATSAFSEGTPLQFRRVHTGQPNGLGAWQALVDAVSTQTVGGTKTFSNPIIGAAGSVTAPAFSTSGDTNTGIYFPAADAVGVTTAGVERMRIDSAGNVGIGTSTPKSQIHIRGAGQSGTTVTDAGLRGGSLRLIDSGTSIGSGGMIAFGSEQADTAASSVGFAAIKGKLSNATANTLGSISFQTRGTTGATNLNERMSIGPGLVNVNGTLAAGYLDSSAGLTIGTFGGDPATIIGGNAILLGADTNYDDFIPNPVFVEDTVYLNIYVVATYWNGITSYNRMTRQFVVTLIGSTGGDTVIANQTAVSGYASSTNFPVSRASVVLVDGTAYLRFNRRSSSTADSVTEFNYLVQTIVSVNAF